MNKTEKPVHLNPIEKLAHLERIADHFSIKANEQLAASTALRETAIALIKQFDYSEIENVLNVIDEHAAAHAAEQRKYLRLEHRALDLALKII